MGVASTVFQSKGSKHPCEIFRFTMIDRLFHAAQFIVDPSISKINTIREVLHHSSRVFNQYT